MQNVGSLMEDEDQNGLAHVLEHMAFHPRKVFRKECLPFLQRHGVETFNAVTKYDETIYHIDHVPTISSGIGRFLRVSFAGLVRFSDVEAGRYGSGSVK